MYFCGSLAAFLLLSSLSHINNVLLPVKYWCPSLSSQPPWIHCPHCSWGSSPAMQPRNTWEGSALPCSQGTLGRDPGMGSKVGWWRWVTIGCRACVAWVKEQHVPSILAQTLIWLFKVQCSVFHLLSAVYPVCHGDNATIHGTEERVIYPQG